MPQMSNKLLPFQAQAISWLTSRPKAFVALEQGLGKTIISSAELVVPAIVVCPASMKWTWWQELSTWRPELRVQVIKSSKDKIFEADVHIINYDILDKVKLAQCVTLIGDESHYAKNYKAKRTKALVALIKDAPRVRLLSGTPIVNRPIEIWALLKAIAATKLGYFEFGMKYCAGWKTPWDTYDFTGSSKHEELNAILEPVMLRMTKEQVMPELPEKTFRVVALDLPIDKREKAFDLDTIEKPGGSIPFEAISDILHMNAQRKLPLAVEYILNALEASDKIVVFAHHTDIIDGLMDALKAFNPVRVTGRDNTESRRDSVNTFQNDSACRVFIGNIKAAGVGLTLTASSHVIFVESSWSPADIEQAVDRTHRIGQKNAVLAEILTLHGSIDEHMLNKALSKIEVIIKIIKPTNLTESPCPFVNLNQPLKEITMNHSLIALKLRELANLFELDEVKATPKEEVKATPKEEVKAAPTTEEVKAAPTTTSINDVREMLARLIDAGKRTQAIAILKANGAAKVGELKETSYAAVVAESEAELTA